jgi:hypothetical protein
MQAISGKNTRSRNNSARFGLAIGCAFFTLLMPSRILERRCHQAQRQKSHPSYQLMKQLERITLATATAVYAGYLIKQAIRTRSERLFRLAAGESPYERTHPKPYKPKRA